MVPPNRVGSSFALAATLIGILGGGAGCRALDSVQVSEATEVARGPTVAAGVPSDAYRPLACPAGASLRILGLKPLTLDVTAEDLGLDPKSSAKPESVTPRAVALRLDACENASGAMQLGRLYLRTRGARGEPRHLTLVIDASAAVPIEDVATGGFTVPASFATVQGLSKAFVGDVSSLSVRVEFGNQAFPSTLIVRGIVKSDTPLVASWIEDADGAEGQEIAVGPVYGSPDDKDPYALDAVCPYGWFRAGMRYALGEVLLELDACEIDFDLLSGEPSRSLFYRALRLTDPHSPASDGEVPLEQGEGRKGPFILADEAAVARVMTFQVGGQDGCDDLEIVLPDAEYVVVTGANSVTCIKDEEIRQRLPKARPTGSVGPFKIRRGAGDWVVGWAESLPAPLPLRFAD